MSMDKINEVINGDSSLYSNEVLNIKRTRDFLASRPVGVIVDEIANAR